MGRKSAADEIQRLLEERRRIEHWLERLEKAGDRTPAAVRERVRHDYAGRLKSVVAELKEYESDLHTSLTEVKDRLSDARSREKSATDELAEAELRYAVGEFADSEWSEKKTGILDRLIRIREDLGQAEEEISEYEEVLASLSTPPPRPQEPDVLEPEPAARTSDTEEDSRVSLGSELGLRELPGGKSAERPVKPAAPKAGVLGDELEFLKALSDDRAAAKPPRRSGATRAVPEPKPAATPVEKLADQQPLSRSRPSVINQRTLKCGECGAMNLPTEWYCDRCGAELASL